MDIGEDIMYNILSRMPVKSLDRFRCASKQWKNYMNDPHLAMLQLKQGPEESIPLSSVWYLRIRNDYDTRDYEKKEAIKVFKDSEKRLACLNWVSSYDSVEVGSCNGLVFVFHYGSISVLHPLKDGRHELPFLTGATKVCGLGFDVSSETFKMFVFVEVGTTETQKRYVYVVVNVVGTTEWRVMRQVPFYRIDEEEGKAVLADGCLHWLGSQKDRKKVIRLEVSKEEFGLIDIPPTKRNDWREMYLVGLNGDVGFVYAAQPDSEVWLLNQNQWVLHCKFSTPRLYARCRVVGAWNEAGSILLKFARGEYLMNELNVYVVESAEFYEVLEDAWYWGYIGKKRDEMYKNSIFSINSLKKDDEGQGIEQYIKWEQIEVEHLKSFEEEEFGDEG